MSGGRNKKGGAAGLSDASMPVVRGARAAEYNKKASPAAVDEVRRGLTPVAERLLENFEVLSVGDLRKAILDLAMRGRLVQQDPRDEPGEDLLHRILIKRAEILGTRDSPRSVPDGVPELTPGWCWASLDMILVYLRNGTSIAPMGDSGVPILRISAVRPNLVNTEDSRYLPGTLAEYDDFQVMEDDLLFTRYSGNAHFVGICGAVPKLARPTLHPDKLIRGIAARGLMDPRFVALSVNVGECRRYIDKCAQTTAGQVGISGKQLKGSPVPIPPLAEQKRIVAKVDQLMKICDALEAALRHAEDKARRLADALVAEIAG